MEQHRRTGGRRAVRPAGTVGGDESRLRSTFPVASVEPGVPTVRPATRHAVGEGRADDEPAVARRSLDDTDLGWGDSPADSNDGRLQRERPPHW